MLTFNRNTKVKPCDISLKTVKDTGAPVLDIFEWGHTVNLTTMFGVIRTSDEQTRLELATYLHMVADSIPKDH